MRAENSHRPVFSDTMSGTALACMLYDVCSPSWIREDGTLEETKLMEFYSQLTRIFNKEDYEEQNYGSMGILSGDDALTSIGSYSIFLYGDYTLISLGNVLSSTYDYNMMVTNETEKGYRYQYLNGQTEGAFRPISMAGISSKSNHKEDARDFIRYLLGEEAQQANQGNGLPINEKALDLVLENQEMPMTFGTTMTNGEGEDDTIMVEVKTPQKKDIEKLKEYIKEAKIPSVTNGIIWEAVTHQAEDCAMGTITPEEATKNVIKQVNLYLAENS